MSSTDQQSNVPIWYLLLDSATGEPYKRTSADKVRVSSSADVTDFREAVIAKNPNNLSSFDTSELMVYENKKDFDANQNPLKSSSPLGSWGKTEEDCIIVSVPSSVGVSYLSDQEIADQIKKGLMSNSKNLVDTSGSDFVYSDRQNSFKVLADSLVIRHKALKERKSDRNLHPIPFLADGPGSEIFARIVNFAYKVCT